MWQTGINLSGNLVESFHSQVRSPLHLSKMGVWRYHRDNFGNLYLIWCILMHSKFIRTIQDICHFQDISGQFKNKSQEFQDTWEAYCLPILLPSTAFSTATFSLSFALLANNCFSLLSACLFALF